MSQPNKESIGDSASRGTFLESEARGREFEFATPILPSVAPSPRKKAIQPRYHSINKRNMETNKSFDVRSRSNVQNIKKSIRLNEMMSEQKHVRPINQSLNQYSFAATDGPDEVSAEEPPLVSYKYSKHVSVCRI